MAAGLAASDVCAGNGAGDGGAVVVGIGGAVGSCGGGIINEFVYWQSERFLEASIQLKRRGKCYVGYTYRGRGANRYGVVFTFISALFRLYGLYYH